MKYIAAVLLFIVIFTAIVVLCYGIGYGIGFLLSLLGVTEIFGIPITKFMGVAVVLSCSIFRGM